MVLFSVCNFTVPQKNKTIFEMSLYKRPSRCLHSEEVFSISLCSLKNTGPSPVTSDPEYVPGRTQRRGRMRQDHLWVATTPIKDGQIRCQAVPIRPKISLWRAEAHWSLPGDTSVQSQPLYGDHARRAARAILAGVKLPCAAQPAAVQAIAHVRGSSVEYGQTKDRNTTSFRFS